MSGLPLVSIVIPTYNRLHVLCRCLDSILLSSYKRMEITVVDNNENSITKEFINKAYPDISVIGMGKNMGASWARSYGAKNSKGDWVLFIDDDNVVEREMIERLIQDVEKDSKIGAVSPIMYYLEVPEKIWFCGANFNFITSKPLFFKEIQSEDFYECNAIHNVYMVKRNLGSELNWLEESLFMGYEEFDLLARIKQKGFKIGICPKAIDWHDHPINDTILRLVNSPQKAFSTIRNRAIIMKRYSTWWQKIIFIVFFYPLFISAYTYFILKEQRADLLIPHLKGSMAGYKAFFFNK